MIYSEPILQLDSEPIATRLSFRYNANKTEEDNNMDSLKTYYIKPEYLDMWEGGDMPTSPDRIITESELISLSEEWGKPVEALLEQLIPCDLSAASTTKEEHTMTIRDFVAYEIQHNEFFPDVDEIDIDTARAVLDNKVFTPAVPDLTPETFMETWNQLVHDPDVMTIE